MHYQYPVTGSCGVCKFTTINGVRKQVTFCGDHCTCDNDGHSAQSTCYPVSKPASYFVQCCIDSARENLQLAREARLFAWLGAAIAVGAVALIYSGQPPRRDVVRRTA